MTYPSGRFLGHSLHKRFSKFLQILPGNLQHSQKRMNKMRLSAVTFIRTNWSKSSNKESYTIELVSNASPQLFPNNTLSSFTNFLLEQLNLESQWKVAIQEIFYPSMYQNVTEGKLEFFDGKNIQSCLNFIIWNLVSTPPSRILLKPIRLSFRKNTITAKNVTQLKCRDDCRKLRFIWKWKILSCIF